MSRSASAAARPDRASRPGRRGRRAFDVLTFSLLAVVLTFAIVRSFALEMFSITSASMAPNLQAGDRVLVDKLTYGVGDLRRGDMVAFEDVEKQGEVAIKRVVALPGDTIAIHAGALLVNRIRQTERYLHPRLAGSDFFGPTIVPSDHVFVLGDNRADSIDSRFTGPVPTHLIVGRVSVRVWPPHRVDAL